MAIERRTVFRLTQMLPLFKIKSLALGVIGLLPIFQVLQTHRCYIITWLTHPLIPTPQKQLGSDVSKSLKKAENQHTPYIGPGPGENSGTHRYTFLLYQQSNGEQKFQPMEHEQREQRRKFDIRGFESENQLELISVNFFCCPT